MAGWAAALLAFCTAFHDLAAAQGSAAEALAGRALPDLLASDGECDEGTGSGVDCAMNALQVRAHTVRERLAEKGLAEARDASARSDGAVGDALWASTLPPIPTYSPTPIDPDAKEQPKICGGAKIRTGHEGCCAGQVFSLVDEGCCGQLIYDAGEGYACCKHPDQTATIYHPLRQNCCDDDATFNLNEGICDLEKKQTSCCKLYNPHGRRRRGQHVSSGKAGPAAHPVHTTARAPLNISEPPADGDGMPEVAHPVHTTARAPLNISESPLEGDGMPETDIPLPDTFDGESLEDFTSRVAGKVAEGPAP